MNTFFADRDWKGVLKYLFVNYNYVFSFALLLIVGRFASDQFVTVASISNLIRSSVFIGIIALGMTMTIISGNIDLSVGSILALAAAISVNTFNSSGSTLQALIVAAAAGAGLGLINGLFVGYARMASFIVTLATMTAYRSVTVQMGQGGPLLTDNALYFENLRWIGYGRLGGPRGLPYLAVIFVLLTLVMWFVMNKTKFGRYVYAVGSNEKAAKLTGIRITGVKVSIFTITGLLTGIAAFLYTARFGSVDVATAGRMFELDVIAAVAIGGTMMSGGRGTIQGSFFGAVIIYSIDAILSAYQVPAFVNDFIKGVLILGAVLLQKVLDRTRDE